jgi:small subunit ribosomal protein S11
MADEKEVQAAEGIQPEEAVTAVDTPEAEEVTPEVKAEPKAEEATPEVKAEPKAEEAKPEVKAEPKAEEAKPEVNAEPKAEEAKPEVKAEPKAEEAKPKAVQDKPSQEKTASESATGATDDRRRNRPGAVPVGVAHVKATFNNTLVSITDTRGGVIAWGSGGRSGFKGSRKSTAFAATTVAQDAARQAVARGMHEIEVHVQGAGAGRESAIRGLQSSGLNIVMIKDVTSIPHNGCRARKRRRV